MLLRGCPEAATSKERRVRQQLKALLEAAASPSEEFRLTPVVGVRPRADTLRASPERTPSRHQDHGDGPGAAASVVKSRLGPNRDARDTIEAHRQAASDDNHRDSDNHDRRDEHRSRYHND
jgi:hypothetical protein